MRLFNFKTHKEDPSITRLQLYLPREQIITIKKGETAD